MTLVRSQTSTLYSSQTARFRRGVPFLNNDLFAVLHNTLKRSRGFLGRDAKCNQQYSLIFRQILQTGKEIGVIRPIVTKNYLCYREPESPYTFFLNIFLNI